MKRQSPVWSVVAVCLLLIASAASAEEKAAGEKEAAVRKLLALSGAGKLGVQVLTQMTQSFRTSMPNVPSKFWDDFAARVRPEELTELVVPLYAQHFTLAEVNDLIHFYETPTGKKLVAVQPQLVQESMAKGQQWGQKMGLEVVAQLRAQGYLPDGPARGSAPAPKQP